MDANLLRTVFEVIGGMVAIIAVLVAKKKPEKEQGHGTLLLEIRKVVDESVKENVVPRILAEKNLIHQLSEKMEREIRDAKHDTNNKLGELTLTVSIIREKLK